MRRVVLVLAVWVCVAGCGRSEAPPQAARPLAAPTPASLPHTLDEVRAAIAANELEEAEAGLHLLSASSDPVVRRVALSMLAVLYDRNNRLTEAEAAYVAAAAAHSDIAPFLELQRMEVLQKLGRYTEAVTAAWAIIATAKETSAGESARVHLPALEALAGDREAAAEDLAGIAGIKIDSLNDEDFVSSAQLLQKAGAQNLAALLMMRVLAEYPQSRFAERLYETLSADPESPLAKLDYAASLALAERLGRVNRYDQSLDLIRRIEGRFPKAASDASLRYIRTVALFNSRRYPEVIAQRPVAGESYYVATQLRRARAFWRNGNNPEFVKLAGQIVSKYPKASEATEAKVILSRYYTTDEIDYEKASRLLSEVIASGNVGTEGENIWALAWIQILAKQDDRALSTMREYLRKYPDADYTSNSLFWTGKLHEKNGRIAERDAAFKQLMDAYPYSYFTYRAREISGHTQPPPAQIENANKFPVEPNVEADHPRLVSIRMLMEVGLNDLAAREMQSLAAANAGDRLLAYTLADLYDRAGQPLRANQLLQRNFRDIVRHGGKNVPPRFWEILYPLPHRETVRGAAEAARVDPHLLAAITRQESGFDPNVVSNAGAVGLMQIMPAEAPRIAAAGGLGTVTRADLFDPEKNIRVGAAEIRQKLDAMNGNQTLAIASYNAGEQAVGRWIARTPTGDIDFFIESIPYAETRLYVKSVTRNLFEYRRIYGGT